MGIMGVEGFGVLCRVLPECILAFVKRCTVAPTRLGDMNYE